jgi:nitrogen-specific signal transduction histidine kinase/ActR/RegA family two-component response regulator
MRTLQIEASISPVHGEEGTITHCVIIERDVTNEARLEKQLQQSQKMEAMGTLAGGIAHDFNNILSIIFGYTDLLMLDNSLGEKNRRHLENIKTAAVRAKELVAQILAFSRQSELQRRPLQIGTIVEEILKLLRATLPPSIKIIQHNDSERMVFADPTQISQVVMNLCTNAAHAMRETGGVLDVRTVDVDLDDDFIARYPRVYPGSYIQLTVSDTGHGMIQTTSERIFEPYFTTKGPGEGTGLGLSVVHGIVESHGGMITVYSEPDEGTVFHTFFPQFQDPDMPLAPSDAHSNGVPVGGAEHILFVDDEVSLVAASLGLLENLGYTVTTRSSSVEALEAFRANPYRFDLVISDLTMPLMGGIDLARELRRIREDIAIIICTGFSGVMISAQLKAVGVSRLLAKPIIFGSLARTVREVLDEARSMDNVK